MMRRGLKRKVEKILDNFEEEPDPYQQGLGDFQSLARKRESMRIKNQVNQPGPSSDVDKTVGGPSWERSLQEQIHVEQQMLEGTAKFINACKNDQQALEGSKRLQLGRLRLEMLRFELGRMKRGRGSPQSQIKTMFDGKKVLARPSYAGVSLSDIRIPLMWKRKDHLNDAGDKRKFAVFCIARIGSQIYDTRLITGVDRSSTDISIDDVILFSRVAPHFEMTLELYSRLVDDGCSFVGISSSSAAANSAANAGKILLATPQKICKSISKAVGKKLSETNFSAGSFFDFYEDTNPSKKSKKFDSSKACSDPYFTNVGPKFEMIASVTLKLEDCSNDVKPHEFYVEEIRQIPPETTSQTVAENSRNLLPLFGHFCCRLAAVPYCCGGPVMTGKIFVRKIEDGEQREPEMMWARLVDWKLSLWTDEQEFEEGALPLLDIPINRDTCILEEGAQTILIINHVKDESEEGPKSSKPKTKGVTWRTSIPLKKITWELSFTKELSTNTLENSNYNELNGCQYDSWLVHLLQHAADHRRWKIAASSKMDVYSPGAEKKKSAASLVSWNMDPPPVPQAPVNRPVRSSSFYFPRIGSLNPSTIKRQKREAKKSFRRTRSKLVLLYNQTGED